MENPGHSSISITLEERRQGWEVGDRGPKQSRLESQVLSGRRNMSGPLTFPTWASGPCTEQHTCTPVSTHRCLAQGWCWGTEMNELIFVLNKLGDEQTHFVMGRGFHVPLAAGSPDRGRGGFWKAVQGLECETA